MLTYLSKGFTIKEIAEPDGHQVVSRSTTTSSPSTRSSTSRAAPKRPCWPASKASSSPRLDAVVPALTDMQTPTDPTPQPELEPERDFPCRSSHLHPDVLRRGVANVDMRAATRVAGWAWRLRLLVRRCADRLPVGVFLLAQPGSPTLAATRCTLGSGRPTAACGCVSSERRRCSSRCLGKVLIEILLAAVFEARSPCRCQRHHHGSCHGTLAQRRRRTAPTSTTSGRVLSRCHCPADRVTLRLRQRRRRGRGRRRGTSGARQNSA